MNPDEIADKEFPVVMRGYSRDDVDTFLAVVADELADRDARLARLQLEVTRLQAAPSATALPVDRPTLLRQLGEEAASILACADASAERIKADAHMTTERVRHDLRAIGNSLGDVHQLLGELIGLIHNLGDEDGVPTEVRIPDGSLPVGGDLPGSEVRTILGEVLGLDAPAAAEIHLTGHDSELRQSSP